MDIGSIFLILGLLIFVGIFLARPFFDNSATALSQEEHEYSAFLAERDRVLNTLQELDFDYTLGKIPEGEYQAQRDILLKRGAGILRQLDALQAEAPESDAEARIEAAIVARRIDIASVPNGIGSRHVLARPDDDLEAMIANRRRERNEKTGGFCPQCGRPVQKSDRFCPSCGETLT